MSGVAVGPLLAALNDHSVPYVVIGGIAVITAGVVRTTEDIDVMIPASEEAAETLRVALEDLGATRLDGSELPEFLFDGTHHIRALTPHGVLDALPEGEPPLDFAHVVEGSQSVDLDGVPTRICGLAELVALKRLADRARDQDDIERLRLAYGELPEAL